MHASPTWPPFRRPTRTPFTFDHLEGYVESSAEPLAAGGYRLRIRVANTTSVTAAGPLGHNAILPFAFVSTHSILSLKDGAFVSLLEPPDEWREAAAACTNTVPIRCSPASPVDET